MQELIPIEQRPFGDELIPTVNSWDLYEILRPDTPHRIWMPRRIEEGQFIEGKDFIVLNKSVQNPQGGRPTKEYHLTLNMAKHVGLLERSKIGTKTRQYFIDFEEKHRNKQAPTLPSPQAKIIIQDTIEIGKMLGTPEHKAKQIALTI